jgi:release factor glutamine methyltransferase
MPAGKQKEYFRLIAERGKRIPLQHLTGVQEFCGLEFVVSPAVLIPRQETELLVLRACGLLENREKARVLDLCTGSGCIAVSIAHLLRGRTPEIRMTASDISAEALAVAGENARRNGTDITFVQSDLFENIEDGFDLIVSNPPYIKSSVIPSLMPEVREHDPAAALDGGEDGLYFYREISRRAPRHLSAGGWLMFEIGFDQAAEVSLLMEKSGFKDITVRKDLSGLVRIVEGRIYV